MTGHDVKAALAAGRKKPSLVIALLSEGYPEPYAWALVRAAEVAHLSEQALQLSAAAIDDDGEVLTPDDGARVQLAVRLSVEAEELLDLLSGPLRPGAAATSSAPDALALAAS
jgi:hypothetical protein